MQKKIALATIVAGGVLMTSLTASAQPAAPATPPAPAAAGAPAAPAEAPKAAEGDEKKIGVGGDLQVLIPIGDLADGSGPLIGPMLRVGYRVIPALELTGRVGFLYGLTKEILPGVSTGFNMIPLYVGGRYFFMEPQAGLYGGVELGMNMLMPKSDPEPPVALDNQTRFGANLGVGYVVSKELPIDIRAQFSLLNLIGKETNEKSYNGLGLSVGYTVQF